MSRRGWWFPQEPTGFPVDRRVKIAMVSRAKSLIPPKPPPLSVLTSNPLHVHRLHLDSLFGFTMTSRIRASTLEETASLGPWPQSWSEMLSSPPLRPTSCLSCHVWAAESRVVDVFTSSRTSSTLHPHLSILRSNSRDVVSFIQNQG